jgi:branched-chain amino acid transport system permease protein
MDITLRQVQDFFQVLTNGVAAGAVYALVAVSFILVYKAVGIVNFAAGEIVAVGGYVGVVLANILGLPLLIALPICIVLMSFFGYGFQYVVYVPLKGKSFLIIAISTLATGIILANGIQLIFGPSPRRLEPLLSNPTVDIKGVFISVPNLIIIFIQYMEIIKDVISKTKNDKLDPLSSIIVLTPFGKSLMKLFKLAKSSASFISSLVPTIEPFKVR